MAGQLLLTSQSHRHRHHQRHQAHFAACVCVYLCVELLPARKVPDAQTATAAKVSCSVFKAKNIGSMGVANSESAETAICFKHALGYNDFSAELQKQIQVVFTCLHTS